MLATPTIIIIPIKDSGDPERAYRIGLYRARHAASELLRRLDELIEQAELSACEDPDADLIDEHVQRASSDVEPDGEEMP